MRCSLRSSMTDPMVSDVSTPLNLCRTTLEEHSLSSQESSNRATRSMLINIKDQTTLSNWSSNSETKVESHSSDPSPVEPTMFPVKEEVTPLRNPFFTCVISKSLVQKSFQVAIPKHFHPFLPCDTVPVVLSCRNNNWEVRYCGNQSLRRMDTGWRKFAVDNNLKIGDGCVFELVDTKTLKFKVQILSGQIPSQLTSDDSEGLSFACPILID